MHQPIQLPIPLLDIKPVVVASLKPGSLFRVIGEQGLQSPMRIATRIGGAVGGIDIEGERPFSICHMRQLGASALVYPVAALWASIEPGEFHENDGGFWKEGTLGFDSDHAYLLTTAFGMGGQSAKHWISLTTWERVNNPDLAGVAPAWRLHATGMDGTELQLASTSAQQISAHAPR